MSLAEEEESSSCSPPQAVKLGKCAGNTTKVESLATSSALILKTNFSTFHLKNRFSAQSARHPNAKLLCDLVRHTSRLPSHYRGVKAVRSVAATMAEEMPVGSAKRFDTVYNDGYRKQARVASQKTK